MIKIATRGRIKNIARGQGKAQAAGKSEQAQEVSKKRRKGNDEMFFLFLRIKSKNVYVSRTMEWVKISLLKRRCLLSSTN